MQLAKGYLAIHKERRMFPNLLMKSFVLALTLSSLAQNVQAQFTYIDTSIYVDIMRDSVFVAEAQDRYERTLEWAGEDAEPQTNFVSSQPGLSVESFAQSLGGTPEEVQSLSAVLKQGLSAFEQEAERLERPNNVGMAFAYLVGVCYMVYYNEEPTEGALLNLQASADAALGSSEEFKTLSDQQCQELYETLVLTATLPFMGYLEATERQDQTLMQTYRDLAASTLESTLGMHPDKIMFTEAGLELRQ
jgi:hypothetical protein